LAVLRAGYVEVVPGQAVNHGTLGWNLYNYAGRITSNIIDKT
jgi:hypothetical protein